MWEVALAIIILVLVVYYVYNAREQWMVAPSVGDWLVRRHLRVELPEMQQSLAPIPFPGDLRPGEIVKCSATAIHYYIDPTGTKRKFQTPAAFLAMGGVAKVREVPCDLLNAIPTGPDVQDPAIAAQSRQLLRV